MIAIIPDDSPILSDAFAIRIGVVAGCSGSQAGSDFELVNGFFVHRTTPPATDYCSC
jgi:hypothetical protein